MAATAKICECQYAGKGQPKHANGKGCGRPAVILMQITNMLLIGAILQSLKKMARLWSCQVKYSHMTQDKKETFGDIIGGDKLVLIDFTAEWCGPCKLMKPILEELRQRMGDKIRILKIDIDRSPVVSDAFNIQSVPTLMLIQNKNILWR